MHELKLIIANKKYSSWSLRPWIAMKIAQIPFEEELSQFDMSTMHAHFWRFSPTKKVPVLVHADLTVWDSLAILEYLAELYPDKNLWPIDRKARAYARSISNEIHAGFPALREECPMNMARTPGKINHSELVQVDLDRIDKIWADCLERSGGPFLFGEFTIADAMFSPVVNRIDVYQLPQSDAVVTYSHSIKSLSAWQDWEASGKEEQWICENVEV